MTGKALPAWSTRRLEPPAAVGAALAVVSGPGRGHVASTFCGAGL